MNIKRLSVLCFMITLSAAYGCSSNDDAVNPVDETPPAAVTDLAAGDATPNGASLSWTAPGDDGTSGTAAQYDIRYSPSTIADENWADATQAADEPAPQAAGNAETFVVTGLSPDTDYHFALKAADEKSNWSALSNIASGTTQALPDESPPAPVTDLAAGDPTPNGMTLSWTAPGDDGTSGTAAQYDIRYSPSTITDENWADATQVADEPAPHAAGNAETFVVTGLSPETDYHFALKTADEKPNWSALSNVAHETTEHEYAWSPLGSGMDSHVNALAVYDGRLIAGGDFTTAGGVAVNNIAAWDGSSWSPLGLGTDGTVWALTVYDGRLIAGGSFYTAGGDSVYYIAAWDGSSWSSLGSGMESDVLGLAVYDGRLIAGKGGPTNTVMAWDGSSWSPLCEVTTGMNNWIGALTTYNNKLIAGGAFDSIDGVYARHIAEWSGVSWFPLGTGMDQFGFIYALTVYNGKLIAGGRFTVAGDVTAHRIAAFDRTWSPLGSGMNSVVGALTVFENMLIAGGDFSLAGGITASRIAAWNGGSWSPLGSGVNGSVRSLCVYDGRLIASGDFTSAGGFAASRIAAWGN
jgi:chitodextrinase